MYIGKTGIPRTEEGNIRLFMRDSNVLSLLLSVPVSFLNKITGIKIAEHIVLKHAVISTILLNPIFLPSHI